MQTTAKLSKILRLKMADNCGKSLLKRANCSRIRKLRTWTSLMLHIWNAYGHAICKSKYKSWMMAVICWFSTLGCWAAPSYNLAFYYGQHPPLEKLRYYAATVFQPYAAIDPRQFNTPYHRAYAYVSIGEVNNLKQYNTPIDKHWVIAENSTWQSLVMDQANPQWRTFVIDHIITPLWNKGYSGFFFDTMDSYQLAKLSAAQQQQQQQGLIALIRAIKAKYPDATLVLNRGFELLPQVKDLVQGVVAESLFAGWDNNAKRYVPVSAAQRQALLPYLQEAKQLGLTVTVIDYVAPNQPQQAHQVAEQITALGFNPWVTDSTLNALPLFTIRTLPRKVLLLYEGKLNDIDAKVNSDAVTKIAMPLTQLGLVPVVHNINAPLPMLSKDEYAGVVVTMYGTVNNEKALHDWYLQQLRQHIPLVMINSFGFTLNKPNLAAFDMSTSLSTHRAHNLQILQKSPWLGYELPLVPNVQSFLPIRINQGTHLLRLEDETHAIGDVAAITPWGGYILFPYAYQATGYDTSRWVINPFTFFKHALHLPDTPIPDTTTENGRRLMFAHIDGDGFMNRGQWYQAPYMGEVVRTEILEHYRIPTTVSIVQGELAPNGLYPKLTPEAEPIARQIFALPYVEIASHTFSHPYNWQNVATYRGKGHPFNLPIPNYHFNLEAEIIGSVNYINTQLAPPGKKCKVFLWSGEGDVNEQALALTYQQGLRNMNGGKTIINKYRTSLTNISGIGIFEGPYFQVFAPIANDFEVTQHAQSSLYEFVNTIDILKMTDQPIRFKPIDIYYHFFTLQQLGGVKAMRTVYDYALSQPIMNIYASEYADLILDFNTLDILPEENGWRFETNDKLREIRIPHTMGYPDLVHSNNVIGYNSYNDDYYVHLGPGGRALLRITDQPPTIPYLVDANARVSHFSRQPQGVDFTLTGYMPLKFTLGQMQGCSLWHKGEKLTPIKQEQSNQIYEIATDTHDDFNIRCS